MTANPSAAAVPPPVSPDAPIGVFDSGVGGLTVVAALHQHLPQESFIYYGDLAHLPYGDKSPEAITAFSTAITQFLLQAPVKALVIACNTASAVAYDAVLQLCQAQGIPCFEVISPAVEAALAQTRTGQIGVIATNATIGSHVYHRKLTALRPEVRVTEMATPLLVPVIESGWFDSTVPTAYESGQELATPQRHSQWLGTAMRIVEAYLADPAFRTIDTLILGCTHYPIIQPVVQRYFASTRPGAVRIINSSDAVAQHVAHSLAAHGLLRPAGQPPAQHDRFYASDLTPYFEATAARFFGGDIALEKRVL